MELHVNLKEWIKKLVYMKTEVDAKLSSKADLNHTHTYTSRKITLSSNFFLTELGNIAIISWWGTSLNVNTANSWQTLHNLPCINLGKTVWTTNIKNGPGIVYFRVNENLSTIQYFSDATGNVPITAGQLIFFIDE